MSELTERGALTSAEWRRAFERVPRHVFVPRVLSCWPPANGGQQWNRQTDRAGWLDVVYSDRLLMIAQAGGRESSSSMPSRMARFLEMADVRQGNTVLEIGAGSGYNAALLCDRLGAKAVTSIDIDAELIDDARSALSDQGFAPTLVVADGWYGYAPRRPYSRIIATCSVPYIPGAWIDQLSPDGVVVAPLTNTLLVGLHRLADDSLEGRAESAGFMPLRSPALGEPAPDDGAGASADAAEPEVRELSERFVDHLSRPVHAPHLFVQLEQPDLRFTGRWMDGDGLAPSGDEARYVVAGDGSWAEVRREGGRYVVLQHGPRRVWETYEAAVARWYRLGMPLWERYGMTVTPDRRQYIWLDDPGSEHRWEVAAP